MFIKKDFLNFVVCMISKSVIEELYNSIFKEREYFNNISILNDFNVIY